jgi:hypothetical protein
MSLNINFIMTNFRKNIEIITYRIDPGFTVKPIKLMTWVMDSNEFKNFLKLFFI